MRSIRTIVALAIAGAMLGGGAARGDAGSMCTWGGSPTEQTGVFTIDPPLTNVASAADIAFTATGDLEGDDPRCTGAMTFEGVLWQGASCRFFVNVGAVTGPDGIARYLDAGAADSQGSVYAAGRSTQPVATFNALVLPDPATIQACAGAGLAGGSFSSVIVWVE